MAGRRASAVERDDAADGSEEAGGPERMCAVSRRTLPPGELIRFVADPAGRIVPDLRRRLPGRGVWLEGRRVVVEKAIKTNAFARSLKRSVEVPEGLADLIEELLRRRALQALSMACKAGLVVSGFSKVEAALVRADLAAVLHASDGAGDGRRKLAARLSARRDASAVPVLAPFTCAELSLALGRPNVIHAALITGGASAQVLDEIGRLERFRSDQAQTGVGPDCKGNKVGE